MFAEVKSCMSKNIRSTLVQHLLFASVSKKIFWIYYTSDFPPHTHRHCYIQYETINYGKVVEPRNKMISVSLRYLGEPVFSSIIDISEKTRYFGEGEIPKPTAYPSLWCWQAQSHDITVFNLQYPSYIVKGERAKSIILKLQWICSGTDLAQ